MLYVKSWSAVAAKGNAVGELVERCLSALGCCVICGFAKAAGMETQKRGSGPFVFVSCRMQRKVITRLSAIIDSLAPAKS